MASFLPSLEDPATHFGLPQCSYCTTTPCTRLRNGHIHEGEYILVTRREIGWCPCPFQAVTPHYVEQHLRTLDFHGLLRKYTRVYCHLTINETLHYNQDHFFDSWGDQPGRVDYLMHLLEHRIIVALGLPPGFESDAKLRKWFHAHDNAGLEFMGEVLKPKQEEEPPETEASVEQRISLTNPRWEHADADKRAGSSTVAEIGDAIKLKADTAGLDEGATATFRICDRSPHPPSEIDVIDGSVQNRVAMIDWTVTLGSTTGTPASAKVEFEARAQGVVTSWCEVKLKKPRQWRFS
jgi:hypothetical protein